MRRYQELIDSVMFSELQAFTGVLGKAQTEADLDPALASLTAINMLNTKYIIYNPEAPPLLNRYALGNAWFADTVILVADSNEELRRLPLIKPGEALVTENYRDIAGQVKTSIHDSADIISLTSYKANAVTYQSSASSERVALFSEIHYPAGWQAYIDGTPVPHFRANYILRGLTIPAGEHEIKFLFKPKSYSTGNKVSFAGSLLLLIITSGFAFMKLKRKGEKE
jgi:hypothetical protein